MNRPATFALPSGTPEDFAARFTTREFLTMCESDVFADMKMELVDGELQRMMPPMNRHGARQAKVMIRLAGIVAEGRLIGEVGIDLGNDTVVACDLAIVHDSIEQNRLLLPEELHLVVEIAETTAARDLGLKRLAYAAAGIAHYWVVDGVRAVIHVHAEPVDGDYAMIHTVRFGEPLAVPGADNATIVID